MKIYGLNGVMTGKLGNNVMLIRNGVQMARQYNPIVKDAKSAGQTEVRAKFKLLSQLSASLKPVIAIKGKGMVSPRNIFTSKNYGVVTFADGLASINLASVQLTAGHVNNGTLSVGRSGDIINLRWTEEVFNATATVYVIYKMVGNQLVYLSSKTTTSPSTNNKWGVTIPNDASKLVIYGYTMRTITSVAKQVFGDIQTLTAEDIAKLMVTTSLTSNDVDFSATSGIILPAATQA